MPGHLALVIGTRPEVVQAYPLADAAAASATDLRIMTVSQHTDPIMSSEVLPQHLTRSWALEPVEITPFTLGGATEAVRRHLERTQPRSVIVIGDTDTSLAGALAATELRLPLVHVEAGLRSGDWTMKEERNRVVIDHIATVCCAPVQRAVERLHEERVHGTVAHTGDVHVDAIRLLRAAGELSADGAGSTRSGPALCTIHRRENILDPRHLSRIVELLGTAGRPIHVAVHPHTRMRLVEHGLLDSLESAANITLGPPLPFLEFIRALATCPLVITDSGGVQKQAYLLGVPCITLRSTTEWTETLAGGWNTLLDPMSIDVLPPAPSPVISRLNAFGDGHAAARILAAADVAPDA
jgi:UDP-N-acetylglucosamine 2-epimerase (non-hydrolysing)/UDP-GlcNAc3NAcA epimerase